MISYRVNFLFGAGQWKSPINPAELRTFAAKKGRCRWSSARELWIARSRDLGELQAAEKLEDVRRLPEARLATEFLIPKGRQAELVSLRIMTELNEFANRIGRNRVGDRGLTTPAGKHHSL